MKSNNRERFERVGAKRVQKVLDSLDLLSKCSNKKNYEYSDEDVKKMLRVIKDKVKFVENSFNQEVNKEGENKFRF